jgi:ATP-dependent Lon protease
MTGEITLRGKVLPVGGIPTKVLAAHRYGLKRVILSERNRRDIDDIPAEVRDQVELLFADDVKDVLREALTAPVPTGLDPGASTQTAPSA